MFIQKSLIIGIILNCSTTAQIIQDKSTLQQDTLLFSDSAHHWYDINDYEKIITPHDNQKRYSLSEFTNIADNILLYQKSNGGWPKNYDMLAILTEDQKVSVLKSKNVLNTTFDNGATHSQLNFLATVYYKTKLEKYREAFLRGINFILSAQYANGGWPQFYPDLSSYRKYITFNDGAMIGIMKLLQKIIYNAELFPFIDSILNNKIQSAYEKGIDCILNCQIMDNGELTAWCQQHDNIDFRPRNARSFEPASISNRESSDIVKFLMTIKMPNKRIEHSIISAIIWFENSKIHGIRVDEVADAKIDYQYHSTVSDKIVVADSSAEPIWTRFNELGTWKPLFCNRDGKVVYKLADVERERRTGYAWYVYDPQEVLDLYPAWLDKWIKK